jgi:hypothetical protein
MELSLERIELTQVGTTARKSTALLPKGKKRQQHVVVGDQTGALLCFAMKRDHMEQVFKTAAVDKEVNCVMLGGAEPDDRDKIFMASSGTVRAYTRKGKEFLRFNTNLTEPIRSMWVGEDDIHTGGEFMYNTFINCKDTYFFIANDRINDLVCEHVTRQNTRPEAVLACQDRMVRVILGNDLHYEAPMAGPVLTVERYLNPRTANPATGGFGSLGDAAPVAVNDGRFRELLYGTVRRAPRRAARTRRTHAHTRDALPCALVHSLAAVLCMAVLCCAWLLGRVRFHVSTTSASREHPCRPCRAGAASAARACLPAARSLRAARTERSVAFAPLARSPPLHATVRMLVTRRRRMGWWGSC